MKIGIITFHWGTNYGGVLQTYALQQYLINEGFDVEIINYKPKIYNKTLYKFISFSRFVELLAILKNSFSRKTSTRIDLHNYFIGFIRDYIKEKRFVRFREKYLNLTKLFKSYDELIKDPPPFDIYICGSDQIWNPFFTLKGERKPTEAYFLNFGSERIVRVAYAASFGCKNYPISAKEILKGNLKNFSLVSLRENSGIDIVTSVGFKPFGVVVDPTLLLNKESYLFETESEVSKNGEYVFSYFLRLRDETTINLEKILRQEYHIVYPEVSLNPFSIENWIMAIRKAKIVLTNSYHGMIFSILFHVPFIVSLKKEDDLEMNDRFYTLLNAIGLRKRVIFDSNKETMNKLMIDEIDWNDVDEKIANLKISSISFIDKLK